MSDPLVRLSRAETALAEADEIVDILDLRTMSQALRVVAVAEGLGEVATHAKIFQLKAERKAGGWLSCNIRPGKPSHNGKVTLADIGLSHSQSSRWQLMAQLDEMKFVGWVDERLMKGQEVTAGGLREYTRNVLGKPHRSAFLGPLLLVPPEGVCCLSGYYIKCDGPLTHEHIVARGKASKNVEAQRYLDGDMNISMTCYSHNVGKLSDAPEARRILLAQKVYRHGLSEVRDFYADVPWKVKRYEFTLEAMLD